jgi:hypothetical protein
MSKKHYIETARILSAERECLNGNETADDMIRATVDSIAGRMADMFAADNPRFDRARFLTACGVA